MYVTPKSAADKTNYTVNQCGLTCGASLGHGGMYLCS